MDATTASLSNNRDFVLAIIGLFLSKIGLVKTVLHRPVEGKVKTLTVRRDSLGNWYSCFSCEVEEKPLPPVDRMVGIDLGLTTFAVLSDGQESSANAG